MLMVRLPAATAKICKGNREQGTEKEKEKENLDLLSMPTTCS